jgi:hypothetical protein
MPCMRAVAGPAAVLSGVVTALLSLSCGPVLAAAPPTLMAILGAAASDNPDRSVAGAGDVDGDGYADVIVGLSGDDDYDGGYVFDFNRCFVVPPNGGEIWNIGATKASSWLGVDRADVWISLNAGGTQDLLAHRVGGADSNSISVTAPGTPSAQAWVNVTPAGLWTSGSDRSDAFFTVRDPAGRQVARARADRACPAEKPPPILHGPRPPRPRAAARPEPEESTP